MIKKWFLIICSLAWIGVGYAGVTGKIAGKVMDAQTRQPIPGVNIMLEGTNMGTVSDVEGNYTILNVEVGTYTVRASIVGYRVMRIENIRVSIDLTTKANFSLTSQLLEVSDAITVVAQRPMIQKDEVATKHFVSNEEINLQPVDSFQEIAQNQAGVVGSHFRGGRSGEVLVLIDGIPVRDPAGAYSGYLGGFTSDVPKEGIQEMEVSLGGFSAEYGNVQSGVLNLAMKEGSQKYTGKIKLTTTDFQSDDLSTPLLKDIYEATLSGPEPLTMKLLPALGIKLPGSLSFSVTGELTDQDQGYYPNQISLDKSLQSKLTWRITPSHKLVFGAVNSRSDWDSYYFWAAKYGPTDEYQFNEYKYADTDTNRRRMLYQYLYVDNPQEYFDKNGTVSYESGRHEGIPYDSVITYYSGGMLDYLWNSKKKSDMVYAIWTHALNPKTYYEIRFQNFYTNYHYAVPDIEDRDGDGDTEEDLTWDVKQSGAHPMPLDKELNMWWIKGDDQGYRNQTSISNSVKADLISQVSNNHLLKAGLEFYHHRTGVESIAWTLNNVAQPRTDIWDQDAYDMGAYLQDKVEFEGIIGLFGLRYDLFNPNGFGDAIEYPGSYVRPYSQKDENGLPILIDPKTATSKHKFSPRIGISHPITERDVIHYTYGHYFQRPDMFYLYRNYRFLDLTKTGNYIGYPDLEPEKTVAYEIGLEHQFTDDFKFTVTGYYKDISNLFDWQKYNGATIQDTELNVFTNADYGNSKGMELTINKRLGRFWGGSLNYTYSVAKGRSSGPYSRSGMFEDAKRMNLLDFDQTHTVNANVTFRTPRTFGFSILGGRPLGNWIANVQFAYGSGLPYTSYGSTIVNDKRMPYTTTTDMKLLRQINISKLEFDLFMDIYNIFDRKNVNWIGDSYYYGATGDPSIIEDYQGGYIRNPQAWTWGRQVRAGFAIKF